MHKFAIFCSTLVLSACSTMPSTSYNETKAIVANNKTADNSTIVVRRDSGAMGMACPIDVYLNGIKYARLKAGESIDIHTVAGTHILSAKFTGKGFCQDRLNEAEVNIKQNENKYFRLAVGANGDFHIFPTLEKPIN